MQTRSFLYIDDNKYGTIMLILSNKNGPLNVGSEELGSKIELINLALKISNKNRNIFSIEGQVGVRRRNSINKTIVNDIGWNSKTSLEIGMSCLFN